MNWWPSREASAAPGVVHRRAASAAPGSLLERHRVWSLPTSTQSSPLTSPHPGFVRALRFEMLWPRLCLLEAGCISENLGWYPVVEEALPCKNPPQILS